MRPHVIWKPEIIFEKDMSLYQSSVTLWCLSLDTIKDWGSCHKLLSTELQNMQDLMSLVFGYSLNVKRDRKH